MLLRRTPAVLDTVAAAPARPEAGDTAPPPPQGAARWTFAWLAPRAASPPFRTRWAAVIAIVSGLLGVLAYPRFGVWPLIFLSVAGLSLAVQGRRARTGAWLGFLYGLAFFVPLVSWTGIYVGPVPWLILAFAEAGYLAGLGAALPRLQRTRLAPFWVGCGWVLQEFVRDRWPFGGFPWGRLAFSQADSPVRWFIALGGAPFLSFMVAVGGAALAGALLHALSAARPGAAKMIRRARWPIALGVVGVVAVPLLGAAIGVPLRASTGHTGHTATVALIQGSVPDLGLGFEQRAQQVLDDHVQQTLKLAAEINAGTVARPSLVVWPENSSDVDPFQDATARAKIEQAVHAVGVPVLVGAILQGPGPNHRRNAGILWLPTTGPGAMYVKRHPVPFAEYIPLRSVARVFSSAVNSVTQDMVAGHGNGLMRGGPFPFGDVICFEVAYDELVRSSVAAGARLLVVQTNNATFGHTAETYQQLAMSQLRAVETGRTVLQVATTGKSAVITPDGRIQQESGALFQPAILDARVPLNSGLTLATRLGAIPEYVLAAFAAALIICSAVRWEWIRRRRPTESAATIPAAGSEETESMVTA